MKKAEHLDNRSLIQFLDEELPPAESRAIRQHLTGCEACQRRCDEFAKLSSRVGQIVRARGASDGVEGRRLLVAALSSNAPAPSPAKIMRRFAWGMALAATLALGVILSPKLTKSVRSEATAAHTAPAISSIDIDGESFITLPYSNPDLPLNAPRIVEMQVPVSSLAAAGIIFQPSPNLASDRTVLANVLLGLDGQPLGVHVLNAD